MNPAQGQMPQHGQPQGQSGSTNQQQRPPMYQPKQIRTLPILSEGEKTKYEEGLAGLWNRANNSPTNSADHQAARQKIMEFSRMLISKIQQRRNQAQQQQQMQQQSGQTSARPPSAQSNLAGQSITQTPALMLQQQQLKQQQQQQQAPPPLPPKTASNAGIAPGESTAAAQRPKIPDNILQAVSRMTFRVPISVVEKSSTDGSKWIEEMRDKYARALFTAESSKTKLSQMEKLLKDRSQSGKPFTEEELRQYQLRRDQQARYLADAQKWMENVRKQQESLQNNARQASQSGPSSIIQSTDASQPPSASASQNKAQAVVSQSATQALVNAATEAAKNQQQTAGAGRASPASRLPTVPQPQGRSSPNSMPAAAQQLQGQALPQHKQEQAHLIPVNTAVAQAHAASNAAQGGRVQTPQSATPATTAGPTRALSHSAALSIANQRAISTPGSASIPGQQGNVVTPSPATGAVNAGITQQQQPGHSHAHPTQQQQQSSGMTAKMPIPKQLPEKATAVPQGVTVGGGVGAGRPTISQGSGILGGVMNQPALACIPAYNHDAEGDHVLSKKKLDELVRQVCGGSAEGREGNMLSPDVEENVLHMADSFIDNILNAACRNAKERGSKVLEIRDIQLVLERTYNIRVPGYSSDELRTVRKVQPSAGWIAKMSAVQAAKVMPGKSDL